MNMTAASLFVITCWLGPTEGPQEGIEVHPQHLLEEIIRPALGAMDLYSREAEILLLATAAQESHCGHYLKQLGSGPALGIYQIEPATHTDLYENYLVRKPDLKKKLSNFLLPYWDTEKQLIRNPLYATAIARLIYWRSPIALPPEGSTDWLKYWNMYKAVFNTDRGAARPEDFKMNWDKYVRGVL